MAAHNEVLNFLTEAYATKLQQPSLHSLLQGLYFDLTQFRNCIPRRRPVRAMTCSGTRTFRLRIPVTPRLHVSSAGAVIVPVPGVILSVGILLENRLTHMGGGFPPLRMNL